MSNDTLILLPQFIKDFWFIALTWLACVLGGILAIRRSPFRETGRYDFDLKAWAKVIVAFIFVVGLLFAGARGLGLKPVRIISAARYTSTANVPLILNTPFTILQTLNEEEIKPVVYFDEKKLSSIYTPEQQFHGLGVKKRTNVVIIILESFSKELIGLLNDGKGYTPCFDSIARQGLIYENAFANGKRSIEAVPAILAGLPAFMDDSYISSRFSGNRLIALPTILDKEGYHTSFFHGGRNGTMGFDEFAHIAGIKQYYGLNEYKGEGAFDGNWGISDEEFLQFYAKTLNTFPQPFFSTVFTLSSHNPYYVPAKYAHSFNDAPNNLLKALRYADYSLGKFFQTISKMPWYKNTLFVMVADHTGEVQNKAYNTSSGLFQIPIVFYHPGDNTLHGVSKRINQQTDIMPSILDYLGINRPFLAFGKSIFSTEKPDYAVNFLGGIYHYFQGSYMLLFDGDKSTGLYDFINDKPLKNNLLKDSAQLASGMEEKLKAMIQQYNSRLFNNTMINPAGL
ncbi:MAG: LTA synthase family protein [Bacteroidota bacterium]|nr:LTA synthase family protein [Bacteroidota bacterium]